jgi:hypothetical protein
MEEILLTWCNKNIKEDCKIYWTNLYPESNLIYSDAFDFLLNFCAFKAYLEFYKVPNNFKRILEKMNFGCDQKMRTIIK